LKFKTISLILSLKKTKMIESSIKAEFLHGLITGDKQHCSVLASSCYDVEESVVAVYEELIKPSMYKIGELWELNKISVATEHLASAIIESLLNELYPRIIMSPKLDKRVIVSCSEKEYHQVGSKMVADIFEKEGWDVMYLGANTPEISLFEYIRLIHPHVLALSLSNYFHFPFFEALMAKLEANFPKLPIVVGGQAFLHFDLNDLNEYNNVTYLKDLNQIEHYLKINRL
jgi:methanogenic corrinoid protein MtbC1